MGGPALFSLLGLLAAFQDFKFSIDSRIDRKKFKVLEAKKKKKQNIYHTVGLEL